jgi:hypothetical protein
MTLPPATAPVDPGVYLLGTLTLMAVVLLVIGLSTWVGGLRRRRDRRAQEWPFQFKMPLRKGWRDRKHKH